MVTYKSARSRPVELPLMFIDNIKGIEVDTNIEVLDKLVQQGFLQAIYPPVVVDTVIEE